jgi:hypothetical protein
MCFKTRLLMVVPDVPAVEHLGILLVPVQFELHEPMFS